MSKVYVIMPYMADNDEKIKIYTESIDSILAKELTDDAKNITLVCPKNEAVYDTLDKLQDMISIIKTSGENCVLYFTGKEFMEDGFVLSLMTICKCFGIKACMDMKYAFDQYMNEPTEE